MSVPIVDKCCCCGLHTATLIIGCAYSVWALLELIVYCLAVTLWPLGKGGQISVHKYAFYVTAAVVDGTHLLASILLVVAAVKKVPSLTLPWTIVTGIISAIYSVISLTGISLIIQDSGQTLTLEIIFLCVCLARTGISAYSIVVVHSWHKQLMMQIEQPEHTPNPGRLGYFHSTSEEETPLNDTTERLDAIPLKEKNIAKERG